MNESQLQSKKGFNRVMKFWFYPLDIKKLPICSQKCQVAILHDSSSHVIIYVVFLIKMMYAFKRKKIKPSIWPYPRWYQLYYIYIDSKVMWNSFLLNNKFQRIISSKYNSTLVGSHFSKALVNCVTFLSHTNTFVF